MGLGSFPLGSGGLGLDPVYKPAAVAPPAMPRAMLYDPRLKQFVLLDVNGIPTDVHPVDQIVAMRLTRYVNDSPSDKNSGTRLRLLAPLMTDANAQKIATTEISRVLGDLITAGDIRFLGVVADLSVYGRAAFAPSYINLRLQPNLRYPQTTVVTINGNGS